jgi:bisphosphoglycerate-dependent phosphoglycerate mutase
MEGGNFRKAREYWVLALKKKPDDADARKGKLVSERKILGNILIELRSLRLSGQMEKALDKALSFNQLSSSWNHAVDPHGVQFLKSELKRLWPFFQTKISQVLKNGFPLKGRYLYKRYSSLFQFYNPEKLQILGGNIFTSGQRKCRDFKQKAKGLSYYGLFVSKFCLHFDPESDLSSLPLNLQNNELYRQLNWDLTIKGRSQFLKPLLKQKMTQIFREGPFYHSEGLGTLQLHLTGKMKEKKKSSVLQKVHQYEVDIPYTEVVKELRWKKVPYEASEKVCHESKCSLQKVIRYKKESYNEPVVVNKVRQEKRYFNYQVNQLNQTLTFDISGKLIFKKSHEDVHFSKMANVQDFEHSLHLPDIGLNPKKAHLKKPRKWFKAKVRDFGKSFKKLLGQKWKNLYCLGQNQEVAMNSLGNTLLRCYRGGPYLREALDKWHQTTIGLSLKKTESLMGPYFH